MASRGQSHGPDVRPDSGSAGSPPLPRLARLAPAPTHRSLGRSLGGRRRVTWWWVTPIRAVSPPAPQAPIRESRHAGYPSSVVGGCRGAFLLPAAPFSPPVSPSFSPPVSPSFSPPLSPPPHPLVTPLPLVATLDPSSSPSTPSSPLSPSPKASRRWASASSRVRKRSSPGPRKVRPLFPVLPLLPPLPIGPLQHHPRVPRVQVLVQIPQHR